MKSKLVAALAASGVLSLVGCVPPEQLESLVNSVAAAVNDTIDNLQETDIFNGPRPQGADDRGFDVDLRDGVNVITDPEVDLRDIKVDAATLLAFDNDTRFDMFIDFEVDGVPQSVLVYAGETTLLEYPCFATIVPLAEWDFDPASGDYVGGYDLGGTPNMDMFPGDPTMGDFDDFEDPNFGDPGFEDPGFEDPFAQDGPDDFFPPPGDDPFNDPMFDDPGFVDPGFEDPNMGSGDDFPAPTFTGQKLFQGPPPTNVCGELLVIGVGSDALIVKKRVPLGEE